MRNKIAKISLGMASDFPQMLVRQGLRAKVKRAVQ
jgi:hypothetical protein